MEIRCKGVEVLRDRVVVSYKKNTGLEPQLLTSYYKFFQGVVPTFPILFTRAHVPCSLEFISTKRGSSVVMDLNIHLCGDLERNNHF